jgi:hypothetical protein
MAAQRYIIEIKKITKTFFFWTNLPGQNRPLGRTEDSYPSTL